MTTTTPIIILCLDPILHDAEHPLCSDESCPCQQDTLYTTVGDKYRVLLPSERDPRWETSLEQYPNAVYVTPAALKSIYDARIVEMSFDEHPFM